MTALRVRKLSARRRVRVSGGGGSPTIPTGKYRNSQPMLFQPVDKAQVDLRVSGSGLPYENEICGPTRDYVDSGLAWQWDNVGGDWLDANQVRMGATPWASILTNAASGGTSPASYTMDVTAVMQFLQTADRWAAFLLRCPAAPRIFATNFFGTQGLRPRIEVVYQGGATATLACTLVSAASGIPDIAPVTTSVTANLPVFLEFQRPTAPVQSATLHFHVTGHFSGNSTTTLMLLDPPRVYGPVTQGLSAAYVLDAGITAHPDVIAAQRYPDGADILDYCFASTDENIELVSEWSPDMLNPAAAPNLAKLPYSRQGKWWGAALAPNNGNQNPVVWDLVPSTHTGEGFQPLAPGIGALRLHMYPGKDPQTNGDITDGSYVGDGGSGHAARMWLPPADCGTLDRVFIRYNARIGTPDGGPIVFTEAMRYNVYKDAGKTSLQWTSFAGKCFPVPSHDTKFGGFSATSGGPMGWQARVGWGEIHQQLGGPWENGWNITWHHYDYQSNNPPGHRYVQQRAVSSVGLKSGLMQMFYVHKWYDVEMEMKLNTITPEWPGYLADGALRWWLDGMQSGETTGLVFRSGPPYNGYGLAVRSTTHGMAQVSSAVISGAAIGKGYIGVAVRASTTTDYAVCAFLSRRADGQVVIGLGHRGPNAYSTRLSFLARSAPMAWADGDELSLESSAGVGPSVFTVRKNGVIVPLDSGIPFQTTAVADTYTMAADNDARGTRVGIFGHSNQQGGGFEIESWSGGDVGSPASDAFSYSAGDLGVVASGTWIDRDAVAPFVVANGKASAVELGRHTSMPPIRSLGVRDILFNWFHGGTTFNTVHRYLFIANLVVSRSRVGPLRVS